MQFDRRNKAGCHARLIAWRSVSLRREDHEIERAQHPTLGPRELREGSRAGAGDGEAAGSLRVTKTFLKHPPKCSACKAVIAYLERDSEMRPWAHKHRN